LHALENYCVKPADPYMRFPLRAQLAATFVALAFAYPTTASAQRVNTIKPTAPATKQVTLDGIVRDREGRLLAAAEVIVDDEHRTITNSRGEFRIPGLEPGVIEFTARRIGYSPVTTAVQVDPGLTVHLAVRLTPIAIQLGTMIVEGKRLDKTLWQTGFYKRQQTGAGQYFDDQYFKQHQTSIGTVVSNVPTVFLDRKNNGTTIALGRTANGTGCLMSVFVDGNVVPWANEGIDGVVNRDDVLAMEVYARASEMPSRIAGLGGMNGVGSIGVVNLRSSQLANGITTGDCGAILIWTKPLAPRR
jgi:hypothetical protein